jgi:hypothetical protein
MSSQSARVRKVPAVATGAHAIGTVALGSIVVGALAVGALAVGALSIGRLVVGRARIRRLEIDELVVHRVRVMEQLAAPSTSDAGGVNDASDPGGVKGGAPDSTPHRQGH